MDELQGRQKWPAIVGVKSNFLVLFFFIQQKHPFSLDVETLGKLSSFTGYFVKMNSLPEKPPTYYLCTIERFITVLYGRTSTHLHEHRHGLIAFVYQKGLINEMTALTKVALYQHSLKAANQCTCVRVSTRTGEMITKSSRL